MGPAAAPFITGGLLLPRLQQGWGVVLTLNSSMAVSPVEQARRMIYGTWVFDAPMLGHLVQTRGGGVLYLRGSGTDHHLPPPPDKPQRLAHAVLNTPSPKRKPGSSKCWALCWPTAPRSWSS